MHYRHSKSLPALERNILKYRAIEMIIILFHVENLKKFVLDSIRATDRICRPNNQRIPLGAKNVYKKVWSVLVEDGILSEAESQEVQRLVDYRNDIAHRVQLLTCDISLDPFVQNSLREKKIIYDYRVLTKLKSFREKIECGFQSKYAMSLSPNELLFEAAEKVYSQELGRLKQRIIRQLALRKIKQRKDKA